MHFRLVATALFISFFFSSPAQDKTPSNFTNPLLPSGADPWSVYHKGYYYYTHTLQDSIVIWKTSNLALLKTAERKTIWVPPPNTLYSKELWAPEIHLIGNKWYVYFAADDGDNNHHRLYGLENPSPDPMKGEWEFRGKISDSSDKWAIDGSVFRHRGQLYMIWSGWEGDTNGQQDIYIGKMKDPLTMQGTRSRISSPLYEWEKHGDLHDPDNPPHVNVNEGPQILIRNDRVFLVYSASGCWTEHYALGMLTATAGSDLMDSASWHKSPQPVFKAMDKDSVYAAGHNSFFRSPDGSQDWILYHANPEPGQGCGKHRSPRAQPFRWTSDGQPDFGRPMRTHFPLKVPSEKKRIKHRTRPA